MERKLELTLTIVVILLVIASAIFYLFSTKPSVITNLFTKQPDEQSIIISKDIHVPEPGETASESGVAIPKAVQEVTRNSEKKLRTFDVIADKNSFSIEKIIVNEGDVVRIKFTAKDKTYDFSIPEFSIKQEAKAGETKLVEFQAVRAGSFIFESKPVQGALFIVPAT